MFQASRYDDDSFDGNEEPSWADDINMDPNNFEELLTAGKGAQNETSWSASSGWRKSYIDTWYDNAKAEAEKVVNAFRDFVSDDNESENTTLCAQTYAAVMATITFATKKFEQRSEANPGQKFYYKAENFKRIRDAELQIKENVHQFLEEFFSRIDQEEQAKGWRIVRKIIDEWIGFYVDYDVTLSREDIFNGNFSSVLSKLEKKEPQLDPHVESTDILEDHDSGSLLKSDVVVVANDEDVTVEEDAEKRGSLRDPVGVPKDQQAIVEEGIVEEGIVEEGIEDEDPGDEDPEEELRSVRDNEDGRNDLEEVRDVHVGQVDLRGRREQEETGTIDGTKEVVTRRDDESATNPARTIVTSTLPISTDQRLIEPTVNGKPLVHRPQSAPDTFIAETARTGTLSPPLKREQSSTQSAVVEDEEEETDGHPRDAAEQDDLAKKQAQGWCVFTCCSEA